MSTKIPATIAMTVAASLILALDAHATRTGGQPDTLYQAQLRPMNTTVTELQTMGKASFAITDDTLSIRIDARNLPPNMMHLQHFHGFVDNRKATCPTEAADKNGDKIIDLIETESTSGTTMVPFHDDPVSMQIVRDTYPKASEEGSFEYRKTVPLSDIQAAFAKAFDGQTLDLDRRVVFIHGVMPSTKLPSSVASLGDIPAQVTLPIACGEIERVQQ